MSAFNAQSAFASGMELGLHGLSVQHQNDLAIAHLALARDQYQRRMDYQHEMMDFRNQMEQRRQQHENAWEAKNDAALAGARQKQEQRASAQLITGLQDAPEQGAAYMAGGHTPDEFFSTAEGLQGAQDNYAQMPTSVLHPMVASALMQSRRSKQVQAANLRLDQAKHQRAMATMDAIAQHNFPPEMESYQRELMHRASLGLSVQPEEMDIMGLLTGRPPPQAEGDDQSPQYPVGGDWMTVSPEPTPRASPVPRGGRPQTAASVQRQTTAQARLEATAGHQAFLESSKVHSDAAAALRAYQSQHRRELAIPTGKDGAVLPTTDPAWTTYNRAMAGAHDLMQAEQEAKDRMRRQAARNDRAPASAAEPAHATAAAPSAPAMSTDEAAQQAWAELESDLGSKIKIDHNDPNVQKAVARRTAEILAGR
jgi:hypothetical protein